MLASDFKTHRGHFRKIVTLRNVENTETKRYFWPLFFAAVSTVFQVSSVIQQGQAAQQQAEFNKQLAERNARIIEDKAKFDEARKREQSKRLLSSQRAAFAKSGVELEGSPGFVIEETAALEELDAQAIRFGGKVSAQGQRLKGAQAELEGEQAKIASRIDLGTTILTSGRKLAPLIEEQFKTKKT